MEVKNIVEKFGFVLIGENIKTQVKPTASEGNYIRSNKQEIINFLIEKEETRKAAEEREIEKGTITISKNEMWGYIVSGVGITRTLERLADNRSKALLKDLNCKWESADPDTLSKEAAETLLNGKEEIETTIFALLDIFELDTTEIEKETKKEEIIKEETEAFETEVKKVEIVGNKAIYKGKEYIIEKIAGFDNSFGEGNVEDNWISGTTKIIGATKSVGALIRRAL